MAHRGHWQATPQAYWAEARPSLPRAPGARSGPEVLLVPLLCLLGCHRAAVYLYALLVPEPGVNGRWLDYVSWAWLFFVCGFGGAVAAGEIIGLASLHGPGAVAVFVACVLAGIAGAHELVRRFW